jgi:CRISPR/Cas system-associated endoribonuclease Cas2
VFESSPHGRVRLKRHRPRRAQSSTFECGAAEMAAEKMGRSHSRLRPG